MVSFAKKASFAAVLLSSVFLTGCITDIVTAPIGLAYNVTKYAVKGTVAVVGGTADLLVPDDDDKDDKKKEEDKKGD